MTGMLAIDFRWWTLIHLIGVAMFLAVHGVSMTVLFRVRKERDRERIRSLLQLSGSTVAGLYGSLGLLLLGGFGGAFALQAWSQAWIKLSVGLLVFISVVMLGMTRPYYRKIKEATELRPSGAPRISDEELAARLSSPIPVVTAALGFGTLIAILYLMIFKPI